MRCVVKDGSKHSVWLPFMFIVKLIVFYGFSTDLKIFHGSQSCPTSQQHSFFSHQLIVAQPVKKFPKGQWHVQNSLSFVISQINPFLTSTSRFPMRNSRFRFPTIFSRVFVMSSICVFVMSSICRYLSCYPSSVFTILSISVYLPCHLSVCLSCHQYVCICHVTYSYMSCHQFIFFMSLTFICQANNFYFLCHQYVCLSCHRFGFVMSVFLMSPISASRHIRLIFQNLINLTTRGEKRKLQIPRAIRFVNGGENS